jgi:hypothetical protein
MSRREQLNIGELSLIGSGTKAVTPLIRDRHTHILLCTGKNIPNGESGYAKGCMLLYLVDGKLYTNIGTHMLSDFQTNLSTPMMGGNFTL